MGLFITVLVIVWIVCLGTWLVLSRMLKSSDSDKLKNRLLGKDQQKKEKDEPAKVALFETEQKPRGKLIPLLIKKFNLNEKLKTLIEQAGLKLDPVKLVQMMLLAFLGTWALMHFVLLSPKFQNFSVVIAGAAGMLPIVWVIQVRKKRLHQFEEIFPDTLEFISRSMRAGHAFSVSLEMIHREFQEPLSTEFKRTFEEHNLGLPLDVALQGLSKRIPLLDVHFFVSAVLLQKRTGGNLAEILDKLAYVIRERFKLRGRIRAVSAHGKMTGIALTCIPIGVGVTMFFVNPAYVKFFFEDDIGNIMLGAAVGFQVLGYLIIRKIVSIEI